MPTRRERGQSTGVPLPDRPPKLRKVAFRLPEEDLEMLRKIARKHNRSQASLYRYALTSYLARVQNGTADVPTR